MRFLLDTQVFLWLALGSNRIADRLAIQLRDPDNDLFLSAVSTWEIAVKSRDGRLPLPSPAVEYVVDHRKRHRVEPLPLEESALAHLERLPIVHRDPFDRMLICQAIEHEMVLVTNDTNIRNYPVRTLWLENEGPV